MPVVQVAGTLSLSSGRGDLMLDYPQSQDLTEVLSAGQEQLVQFNSRIRDELMVLAVPPRSTVPPMT